jgi:hypothetical protein
MAKISPNAIYAESIKLLGSAKPLETLEAKFLNTIHHEVQSLHLNGLDVFVESQSFGGWFSQKSRVLFIHAKKSKVKKLTALFFITHNGNAYALRLYEMVHPAYIEAFKEKPEAQRPDFIKNSFETLEERQDFTMFRELTKMLWSKGVSTIENLQE